MTLKTIKIKENTYKELIKSKAKIELQEEQLISFDILINKLIKNHKDINSNKEKIQ